MKSLLFLVASLASAQGLEIWETVEVPMVTKGRLTTVVHSQFRQRGLVRDLLQGRVGPVVQFRRSPRLSFTAGYYFGEFEQETARWGNNHRTFASAETPLSFAGGRLRLRLMGEHHFGGPDAPELRIRELAMWVRRLRGPVSAILSTETFCDQNGYILQRYAGGLRLPFLAGYRVDVTYFYDARVQRAGPPRHVIQTAFRPGRRE